MLIISDHLAGALLVCEVCGAELLLPHESFLSARTPREGLGFWRLTWEREGWTLVSELGVLMSPTDWTGVQEWFKDKRLFCSDDCVAAHDSLSRLGGIMDTETQAAAKHAVATLFRAADPLTQRLRRLIMGHGKA